MEKNVCTEDSCISVINFALFDWSDIVMYVGNLTYRGFVPGLAPDTTSDCLTCDVHLFTHKIFYFEKGKSFLFFVH